MDKDSTLNLENKMCVFKRPLREKVRISQIRHVQSPKILLSTICDDDVVAKNDFCDVFRRCYPAVNYLLHDEASSRLSKLRTTAVIGEEVGLHLVVIHLLISTSATRRRLQIIELRRREL